MSAFVSKNSPHIADINYLELLNSLESGVILLDKDERIVFINRWFLTHIEFSVMDVVGKTLAQIFPKQLSIHLTKAIEEACQQRLGRILSFQFHKSLLPLTRTMPTGGVQDVHVSLMLRPQLESDLTLLQCQDVTNSVRREQHLRANEQVLKTERQTLEMIATGSALEQVSHHLCVTIENLLNKQVRAAMLLLNNDGESFDVLSAPSFPESFQAFIKTFERKPYLGPCRDAFLNNHFTVSPDIRNDASWLACAAEVLEFNLVSCWAMPVVSARNDVLGVLALYPEHRSAPDTFQKTLIDRVAHLGAIAFERHQHIERINYLAMHDALTGLANRSLLSEYLGRNLHRAQREKQRFALLFIDLDGFKQINDVHGHDAGDDLLIMVSQRLSSKLRQTDICARIGGDEFVVMLESVSNAEAAMMVAEQLCYLIAEPIKWGAIELHVSASIGVSVYPEDGNSAGALLNRADDAMYAAKEAGRNCCMRLKP